MILFYGVNKVFNYCNYLGCKNTIKDNRINHIVPTLIVFIKSCSFRYNRIDVSKKGVIDFPMDKILKEHNSKKISYKAQVGCSKLTSFFGKAKKEEEKKKE